MPPAFESLAEEEAPAGSDGDSLVLAEQPGAAKRASGGASSMAEEQVEEVGAALSLTRPNRATTNSESTDSTSVIAYVVQDLPLRCVWVVFKLSLPFRFLIAKVYFREQMSTEELREYVKELEEAGRYMQNDLEAMTALAKQKEDEARGATEGVEAATAAAEKNAKEAAVAVAAREGMGQALEEARWKLRQVEKQLCEQQAEKEKSVGRLQAALEEQGTSLAVVQGEAAAAVAALKAKTAELEEGAERLEVAVARADAAESQVEVLRLREGKRGSSMEAMDSLLAELQAKLRAANGAAEESADKLGKAEDRVRELYDRTQVSGYQFGRHTYVLPSFVSPNSFLQLHHV
jgi:hypothetical protein